ncbi:MAG: acyl carrier protein [Ruminococcus sp.]|nr:acyl carrier protein [Ruminococcus sp.]
MIDKLKEMITNYVEVDESEITEGSRFAEDLGFNSYDFMCMLGDLEDELDVEVEESEAFKLKTVSDLAGYLEGLANG